MVIGFANLAVIVPMLIALGTDQPTRSDQPRTPIGAKVSDLVVKDIRFSAHSLSDLGKDKRGLILVFVEQSCPLAKRYLPVLEQLHRDPAHQAISIVLVDVGWRQSVADLAHYALKHQSTLFAVKDTEGKLARACGVERVPTAVLLNEGRQIVYRGRIDDQHLASGSKPKATELSLKQAMTDLLAGRVVARPETTVDGCPLELESATLTGESVSAEQVRQVVSKHCVSCHQPGQAAPFSLLTWDDVLSRRAAIREATLEHRMPPWHVPQHFDQFVNRPSMTTAERETLHRWLDQKGQVDGQPIAKATPKTSTWRIQTPDLVLKSPIEHELPAAGLIDYRYVIFPHMFLHDTWVNEIEIVPDNPGVVHHCNIACVTVGERFSTDKFITGHVPGGIPMTLGKNIAYKIPAGSMIGAQIHYVSTGKPERCRISVGLRYPRETVHKQLRLLIMNDNRFAIPPFASHHLVERSRVLPADAFIEGFFAHMHLRGKDMTFTALPPQQKPEELIAITNYNYDWQAGYRYEPNTKLLPKGTTVKVTSHFDNSPRNQFNPDPAAMVRYGDQVHEEMMFGFMFYVAKDEQLNLTVNPKNGSAKPNVSKPTAAVK